MPSWCPGTCPCTHGADLRLSGTFLSARRPLLGKQWKSELGPNNRTPFSCKDVTSSAFGSNSAARSVHLSIVASRFLTTPFAPSVRIVKIARVHRSSGETNAVNG